MSLNQRYLDYFITTTAIWRTNHELLTNHVQYTITLNATIHNLNFLHAISWLFPFSFTRGEKINKQASSFPATEPAERIAKNLVRTWRHFQ